MFSEPAFHHRNLGRVQHHEQRRPCPTCDPKLPQVVATWETHREVKDDVAAENSRNVDVSSPGDIRRRTPTNTTQCWHNRLFSRVNPTPPEPEVTYFCHSPHHLLDVKISTSVERTVQSLQLEPDIDISCWSPSKTPFLTRCQSKIPQEQLTR
ncbi:hypothetical protein Bbelb_128030 [Branchiostoma belcheri]|nr:hypothetical protein Bbelb_128030 [Branchiostoma belcheri]